MSKENIGRIYSRKRFLLKPQFDSSKDGKDINVKNNTSIENSGSIKNSANIENNASIKNGTKIENSDSIKNSTRIEKNASIKNSTRIENNASIKNRTRIEKNASIKNSVSVEQRGKQPNISNLGFKSNDSKKKLRKKIIKLIILAILIMLIIQLVFYYFEPIFEAMCEEKVKSLATIITNQQSTLVMNKYQYEELYTIEKDSNGNIVIIKSNIVAINNLISELTANIQNEFDKIENPTINIPLGNLSGIYLLSGSGPEIPIEVSITGTVDTEIKSEFIAQGINQTLHRVYVNFECNMKIVTPLKNYTKKVTNQVIIAEHVIVGNIPDSYYNLEGLENREDTLNVID